MQTGNYCCDEKNYIDDNQMFNGIGKLHHSLLSISSKVNVVKVNFPKGERVGSVH